MQTVLKYKAELPIESWLGFFIAERGIMKTAQKIYDQSPLRGDQT